MKTIVHKKMSREISILLLFLATFWGCNPFPTDGITDPGLLAKKGYFYIADRGSNSLVMLDASMLELKRWSLNLIAPDTVALQGITFGGKNVWLAFSGNEKIIAKVDATGDTLAVIHSIPVPPVVSGATQGTIRGIGVEGNNMWVVNSGSATYALSPTLYKIDLLTDLVSTSYLMPSPSPRGITYAAMTPDVYGAVPLTGLYYTDNTTKKVHYFNNKSPFFDSAFTAPIPPAGTTYDQPLGITNDGTSFYTLSYSSIASYLFKCTSTGYVESSYKLPYKYPVAVVWSNYDIRFIDPPAVSAISPAFGSQATTQKVSILGTGFKNNATVSLGAGITVSNLTYVSPTTLTANLIIDSLAVIGKRTVEVVNPDGRVGKADSIFTVTPYSAVPVVEYLYVADNTLDSLFQIRVSDSTIVQSWSTKSLSVSHCRGMAFDGTNLWMAFNSTDYKIHKVNTNMAGATLISDLSFSCPSIGNAPTVQNLTYNNGALWLAQTTVTQGIIYKLDPATGAVLDSIITPGAAGARGIVFRNGLLYCNDRDTKNISSCDPAVKTWTTAFPEPVPPAGTTSTTGMFFNGTNFWMANSGGATALSDVLMEVSPTGSVLRYLTSPYAGGTAAPWGIVYIAK